MSPAAGLWDIGFNAEDVPTAVVPWGPCSFNAVGVPPAARPWDISFNTEDVPKTVVPWGPCSFITVGVPPPAGPRDISLNAKDVPAAVDCSVLGSMQFQCCGCPPQQIQAITLMVPPPVEPLDLLLRQMIYCIEVKDSF